MYVPSSPYAASVLKGIISNRVLGFEPVTFGVYGYKPAPLLTTPSRYVYSSANNINRYFNL